MKFLILGDMHGQKPKIHFKDFDAIICPGDFCSDAGIREPYSVIYKEFLKDPYNHREWWDVTGKKKAKKMIDKSLADGRKILKFLDSFGVPVYIVPGNHDWTGNRAKKYGKTDWRYPEQDHFSKLLKGLKNIVNLHGKSKVIGDYRFVGLGIINGPELMKHRGYEDIFNKKDIESNKKRVKKLLEKYDKIFKKSNKTTIFISHVPPFKTKIDMITNKKSPRCGWHYGSLTTRKTIEKYKPLLTVSGHMHEHYGKIKLGKTTCIASGFGSDANTLVELEGNKIKKIKFFSERR